MRRKHCPGWRRCWLGNIQPPWHWGSVGARWAIRAHPTIRRAPGGRPPRTRSGVLKQAARACARALADAGVRVLVVGSVAYGAVRPESDLDPLIVSHAGKTWGQVRAIVDEAAAPCRVPVAV